ncbi:hypothetical protein AXX12_02450 [Anaerosporomusa subterranea]|uniref:Uncharacterized protein n=1 Tax=Anaerosporomusa subterranea TaxID=1794912 RepID=A0A154BSW9_ANASB|nr:hypothetical protein AXX12_02450 [Anaerosporomusa subterranea]
MRRIFLLLKRERRQACACLLKGGISEEKMISTATLANKKNKDCCIEVVQRMKRLDSTKVITADSAANRVRMLKVAATNTG